MDTSPETRPPTTDRDPPDGWEPMHLRVGPYICEETWVRGHHPYPPFAVAAVREITDGGADFVYEAAGSAEALSQGIAMARKGGSVVMLTVHKRVEVDLEPAIRGELH